MFSHVAVLLKVYHEVPLEPRQICRSQQFPKRGNAFIGVTNKHIRLHVSA